MPRLSATPTNWRSFLAFRARSNLSYRRVERALLFGVCLIALTGCVQTISPELRYLLAQPIRCESAAGELALLREIRPDGARQAMTVVNSLSPPGIAGMIVTQDFENRRQVVSGEHGATIDRRIADIQARCPTGAIATPPARPPARPAGSMREPARS